jgi:oligoribonuclease (3'-5' exoribonuclease)
MDSLLRARRNKKNDLNFMSGIEKKKEKMIERAIIITDKNSGCDPNW